MNASKPKYNIVTVKTVGEKDFYTRRGGFNILFDALPTNGRVLLRREQERSNGAEAPGPKLACGRS